MLINSELLENDCGLPHAENRSGREQRQHSREDGVLISEAKYNSPFSKHKMSVYIVQLLQIDEFQQP